MYLPSFFFAALVAHLGERAFRHPPGGRAAVVAIARRVADGRRPCSTFAGCPRGRTTRHFGATRRPELSPSLLGIQGRVRYLVQQAEAGPAAAPQRGALLADAAALVESGFRVYDRLGVMPVDGYYNYQRLYLSKLHYWKGRIAEAESQPVARVIDAYQTALTTNPANRAAVFMLARVHAQAALRARQDPTPQNNLVRDHAERSLAMVARFVKSAETKKDKRRARRLLDGLQRHFPPLRAKVIEIRSQLEQVPLRNPAG